MPASDSTPEEVLTINQVSAATGLSAHTLRYYERIGLIHPVSRSSGSQRRYTAADLDWLRFLLRLRATGMPIAQMRQYADLRQHGPSSTAQRLGLLRAHQEALQRRLVELHQHEEALNTKILAYEADLAEVTSLSTHTGGPHDHPSR